MSRTRRYSEPSSLKSPFLCVALAALIAAPVLAAGAGTAQADVEVRVKARAKVKVRVGTPHRVQRVRVRAHRPYRTVQPRVRLRVGGPVYVSGGYYVGGRFAAPPPPPPPVDCDCDSGPVVVDGYQPYPAYRPAYAPPAPVAVAPAVVHRSQPAPLPRLGIGVFAGGIEVGERVSGEDVGVFGRLRLTDSFLLEGELAHTEMEGARIDRRVGAALVWDLMPRSTWSIQLMGGVGVTQVELGEGVWQSDQEYGEVGVGLSWRLSQHLTLAGDIRAGGRARVDSMPDEKALQDLAPDNLDEEQYSRGRLAAILSF